LVCGDALIGLSDLSDLKQLTHGIPDAAFKPLSGDDKAVCKEIGKENKEGLKAFAKRRDSAQFSLTLENAGALTELEALEAMPADTTGDITAKEAAYAAFLQHARSSRLAHAADLFVGAFLAPKRVIGERLSVSGESGTPITDHRSPITPTSKTLYLELFSDSRNAEHEQRLVNAHRLCVNARVLHWPLAFPQVFARGGFDCVLGNPPWERIKLQEEEFFATRHPLVALAKNKSERGQRIQWLEQGMLARHLYPELEHLVNESEAEQRLHAEFITARRTAEAASVFAHLKGEDGGRYPLTGVGDVNTYALFAETISQIVSTQGRAGFIVPTGIATDDSTKAYFAYIALGGRLASLYDFENRDAIFPGVHRSYKFCLLTLGQAETAEFAFFLTDTSQLTDDRRRFALSPEDFRRINPNTRTCPVFRSRKDAELTKKIYNHVPVLIREAEGGEPIQNPWVFDYMTKMFDMADNSHEFLDYSDLLKHASDRSGSDWPYRDGRMYAPLYEAKHVHLFDHRWASCAPPSGEVAAVSIADKRQVNFAIATRYWVDRARVNERLESKRWNKAWLMGWRDICRATDERTVIAAVFPRVAVAHTLRTAFIRQDDQLSAVFIGCLSSLVVDYAARQKVGSTHLTVEMLKQLPILPPGAYAETDIAFIVPRVLELTYTAHDLKPWAQDLGYDGPPFAFDPQRRADLRAELDAYYARLYGLSREDLCYILDPESVMGAGYPSETFRVLKNNEEKEFGEYRTQRLVLEAWDRLNGAGES
jgi:hypothetical protein